MPVLRVPVDAAPDGKLSELQSYGPVLWFPSQQRWGLESFGVCQRLAEGLVKVRVGPAFVVNQLLVLLVRAAGDEIGRDVVVRTEPSSQGSEAVAHLGCV